MELAFLLLLAVSAAVGLVVRNIVSQTVARAFLALGLGALVLAIAVLGLTVAGWSPFATLTGSLAAVVLFLLAALTIPFALAIRYGRSSTDSGVT